jgi:hypothetical protein
MTRVLAKRPNPSLSMARWSFSSRDVGPLDMYAPTRERGDTAVTASDDHHALAGQAGVEVIVLFERGAIDKVKFVVELELAMQSPLHALILEGGLLGKAILTRFSGHSGDLRSERRVYNHLGSAPRIYRYPLAGCDGENRRCPWPTRPSK